MSYLSSINLPDKDKEKLKTEANKKVKNIFAKEIKNGKEYQKTVVSGKDIVLGVIGFLIIGLIVSFFFPPAFIISVALAVLSVIGNMSEKKKNVEKKQDYELVQKLIKAGYNV